MSAFFAHTSVLAREALPGGYNMSMDMLNYDICIVGAGAAGLWAAEACARRGVSTLVLEKTSKTGTKILSSGGTRCNLTTTLEPAEAARWYGDGRRFVLPALRNLSPQQVRARFETIGVRTKVEERYEKVFPRSDSALEVRNALERAARDAGAVFRFNGAVHSIEQDGDDWWVHGASFRVRCARLLLCVGGKSYPKTGTTGDGYAWLSDLGLELIRPVPALVPLSSDAKWAKALSGVSVDAEVKAGRFCRRRPVLFTHRGLSGPGAMDVSEAVARGDAQSVRLDLCPDTSWESLRDTLVALGQRPGSPGLMSSLSLPKRLAQALFAQAGLDGANPRANLVTKAQRHKLVDSLKGLEVPATGTLGYGKAEVTAGGLALSEVRRQTMEVQRYPGLYVFGELLDLQGPIGGFNFQAAFATAELAAAAACASGA